MAAGADCNKQNARRSRIHAGRYARRAAKAKQRKDRNVLKSSHGRFKTVEALAAHQVLAEAAKTKASRARAAARSVIP